MHAGRLLVALPALSDPNFERAVVLLLDHDDDGALGVVLNRPTGADVEDVVPGWGGLLPAPRELHEGGPVQPDAVVALGLAVPGMAPAQVLAGRIRTVDPTADPAQLRGEVEGARMFAGYAGWGPGQLEQELLEGAWTVVDAEPSDVVTAAPWDLWRTVLARQDGSLRLLASYPDDVRAN